MDSERFVCSFDDTEIFVRQSGTGSPTLVLCDGLGCDGFIWRFLRPHFSSRYRVLHWNYRGHGQSGAAADPSTYTVAAAQRDLQAVLDACGETKVVLVGHSLGCQIALELALQHHERVSALVLICGAYGRPLDTFHDSTALVTVFPFLRAAVKRWPYASERIWRRLCSSELAYQVAARFEVNGRLVRRADLAPYFEHLANINVHAFLQFAEDANNHTLEERLGEVRAPALIIAGDRDTFTPLWVSRRMHGLLPVAELLVIPGGTHVAPLEIPDLAHLRIEQFLRERVPSVDASTSASGAPHTQQ